MSGFSSGAQFAIEWCIDGDPFSELVEDRFKLPGFIGVCPPRDTWVPAREATAATQRSIRGYLFTGELDPRAPSTERLHRHLTSHGLTIRLERMLGVEHGYPPNFDRRLLEAVRFVISEGDSRR